MAGEYIEFNNNSQPALNDTNINRLQQLIKQDIQGAVSGDTLPVGAIMPFGSDTIPDNWLLCNGQAISRTTYQELFNTIGITYGSGDGFTTFNLPDLQGKIPVGLDENDTDFDTLGNTGGEKNKKLRALIGATNSNTGKIGYKAEARAGTESYSIVVNGVSADGVTGQVNHSTKVTDIDGNDVSIIQPYIVQNYIIKAKQSAGVVATVVDGLNSTSATNALSANQGKILNDKLYSVLEQMTNIDGVKENGKYGIFNATGTLPSGYSTSDNNIIIECIMWNNSYGRQILHDVRSDNTYIRRLSEGTWHSWKIFTIS